MKLREITIEVTQQCPNSCLYCSSLSNPSKKTFLQLGQIEKAINDAVELGTKSISLSGGEPFLHPDILRIIDYIYKKGVECYVYTSGIMMSEGKPNSIPAIKLASIKGKVTKLIVNIEAADEVTYNTIMGTNFGGFLLMRRTVRDAISIGLNVEAHVVPMKLNLQQLPQIIALCSDLGISRVSFLRLVVQGRALANQQRIVLSDEETLFAKYLIATGAKEYKSNIRLGIPFRDCSRKINCMTGTSKLDIRYDGKVYPCEAFKNDNISNVITVQSDSICDKSLKEIYQTSDYLIQVRQLLNDFQSIDTCETCINQFYVKYGKH